MSTSVIQNHVLAAAKLLGLKTVFTEHSHFNFGDLAGINLNKLSKWSMKDVDAAICVSHCCKENFYLRTAFNPNDSFVIPNAVDPDIFYPDFAFLQKKHKLINIVFISRL